MKMTPFIVYLTLMFGLCQGKVWEIPVSKQLQDCYDTVQYADIQNYIGSKLSWLCENSIIGSQMNRSVQLNAQQISYYKHLLESATAYLPGNTGGTIGPRRKRQARRRCVRRELRVLSDEDRGRYNDAVNALKMNTTVPPNKYDAIALLHEAAISRAHFGAGFLGWHRLLLLMFEAALQDEDPSVCLTYWDSTLDNELDDPAQSSVWTPEFFGTANGPVVQGPAANWITPDGVQLIRNVGADGELFTATALRDILSRGRYEDIISSPRTRPRYNLEFHHGGIHMFCGGTLTQLATAAFDPIFFQLHAFVDAIWARFRTNLRARGVDPQIFPNLVTPSSPHHSSAATGFGDLLQVDAYGDAIAETFEYQLPPVCSSTSPQCGSRYLTCLERIGRCVPIDAATAMSLPPDPANSRRSVSQGSQPPGPATTPGPVSPGSQPCGLVSADTRCLRQEKSNGQAIQNDFCADNTCDSNKWVIIAVEIISARPQNFNKYHSYPVHNGRVDKHDDIYSPRAYAHTNRSITKRMRNPKTYKRCKGDSAGWVFLSSRGLNYQGFYKEAATVDQRLMVSISMGFVAVKKPTGGEVTKALIRAHDSCGRECQAACRDMLTGQYKKCKGAIAVSTEKPLMYGTNNDEAVMSVFDYEFNLPQFKSNNVFLAFHCDYHNNFPYTNYKNGTGPVLL